MSNNHKTAATLATSDEAAQAMRESQQYLEQAGSLIRMAYTRLDRVEAWMKKAASAAGEELREG